MAHGRLFISKWLKRLNFFLKPREAKEKPLPIYKNNWFDPEVSFSFKSSDLSELWSDDSTFTTNVDQLHNMAWGMNDHPMEVFLDEDGNIKEPLEQGVASCNIDRWYMPDCVPGIQSTVNVTGVGGHYKPDFKKQSWPKVITVLFANDRYIHLAPNKAFYIEPENDYYLTVEAHFTKRGIDHLSEGTSASLINYIRHKCTKANSNGQRPNKAGTSNSGTFGWEFTNSKININSQFSYESTCNNNTFTKITWTEI